MGKSAKKSLGKQLKKDGFDKCSYDRSNKQWRIGCSQCEALVINKIACHEIGCPNGKKVKR